MLTATGTTLGTPHYMAPEQAMGQAVGPWTDLYSVGCMAYEIVAGRLPFGDVEAPMAVLLRHINEAPVPACDVAPDVDPRLSDWISVLMAKDPAARPQTAAEAWDTLEELVLAVAGPRWRRTSALPARGTEQVPGPYTPPPSSALPSHPVFETFHAPPPARPPIDLGSAEEREDAGEHAGAAHRRIAGRRRAARGRGVVARGHAARTRGVAHRRARQRLARRDVAHERAHRAATRPGRERDVARERPHRTAPRRGPRPAPRHRGVVVARRSSPCRSPASPSSPRHCCRVARIRRRVLGRRPRRSPDRRRSTPGRST